MTVHVLVIVNSATMDTGDACIFLNYGFLWVYPQEWDWWLYGKSIFRFTFILLSIGIVLIYILTNSV